MANDAHETRRARGALLVIAILVIGVGLALWQFSPLVDIATPERLAAWLGGFRHSTWAPAAVVGLYVAAGFVVFPLLLLIAATAVVFEAVTAIVVSLLGSLANAMVLYFVGARLARRTMQAALGGSLERVRAALRHRGVVAIALLRSVPVAPFTVVNLAAGSIGVAPRDYLLGTALGLAPGIVLMTAFGNRLRLMWETPTSGNIAMLVGIAAVWVATVVILQRVTTRVRAKAPPPTSNS